MALWAPPLPCRAEAPIEDGPVLTPDVGPRVEAAFARAEPTFRLEDAKIHPRRVEARVCRPTGECLDLTLTPPDRPCPGQQLRAWCLTFRGAVPPDAALLVRALDGEAPWHVQSVAPAAHVGLEAAAASLAAVALAPAGLPTLPAAAVAALVAPGVGALPQRPAADWAPLAATAVLLALLWLLERWLWRTRRPRHPRLRALWTPQRRWLSWLLIGLGAALGLGHGALQRLLQNDVAIWGLSTRGWLAVWWLSPLSAGLLAGLLLRWGGGLRLHSRLLAWLLVLGLPLGGAAAAIASRRLGAMDGGAMALVAAATFLGVTHSRVGHWRAWLLAAAASALGLGALEGAARLLLPPPPVIEAAPLPLVGIASPRPDGLPVASGELLVDCALHAEIGDETARCLRLQAPPAQSPWLLHLGDSMIFGSGGTEEAALPVQLAARLPAFGHRNGGVPGTSLDVQFALLQRIVGVARPTALVVYAMPGNDVDEIGLPAESCRAKPPLHIDATGPHFTCATADWAPRSWRQMLLYSRLPLPIAALTDVAFVARHLEWLHRLAIEPPRAHELPAPRDAHPYGQWVQALVKYAHDKGIPLQFVVMPLRRSLYGRHAEPRREQVLAALRATGLPLIDTQAAVDAWVEAKGEGAVYLDHPPGHIHLNPNGLRQLADFLAPRIVLPHDPSPTE